MMAADTRNNDVQRRSFYENFKEFPPTQDGKINAVKFLEATTGLISIVERLGKSFAPVRYDMQGNINKIVDGYDITEESCLLELMRDKSTPGKLLGKDGVLWLNRALLFFDIFLQEMLYCLERKDYDCNMKKAFIIAYEGSVKVYHNWAIQKLFNLICAMSPSLSQVMKNLEIESIQLAHFESVLRIHHSSMRDVRRRIDDFFMENN